MYLEMQSDIIRVQVKQLWVLPEDPFSSSFAALYWQNSSCRCLEGCFQILLVGEINFVKASMNFAVTRGTEQEKSFPCMMGDLDTTWNNGLTFGDALLLWDDWAPLWHCWLCWSQLSLPYIVWGDILFVQSVSPSFAQIIATSFGSSVLAEHWAILPAGTWPSCMSTDTCRALKM